MQRKGSGATAGRIKEALKTAFATGREIRLYDWEAGLIVRVPPSQRALWVVRYHLPRRGQAPITRYATLGPITAMTIGEARTEARRYKAAAKDGRDLKVEEEAAKKAEAEAARRLAERQTLQGLGDRFFVEQQRRVAGGDICATYFKDQQVLFRKAVAVIGGDKPVEEVSRRDISQVIGELAAQPATARRAFLTLSLIFDFALREEDLEHNPCDWFKGRQRPRFTKVRDWVPEMDMLRRLWDAADVLAAKPRRHAECYRALQLAIALPLRIGEIIKLRCRDVDVFARVIQLPSTITKTRKAFKLYLNDPARWVIRTQLAEVDAQLAKFGREREPQDLLFGAAKGGPLSRSSDTVEDLRIEAGLADYPFTAHTCRKAFQTRLREARLGLDTADIDSCLSHAQPTGARRHYDFAERWPERKACFEAWGRLLERPLIADEEEEKVVAFAGH